MKAIPRFFGTAICILTMHSCVNFSIGETYGIAAVVNGKPITRTEVRAAVEAQEQMIRMTVKDEDEARRRLSDLHERALDALIERQLVLSEFDKMGGSIKPEYIEDEIKRIIIESFGGDREKFIIELAKTHRIVITIEGPTSGMLGETLTAILAMDGVLAANMVFEHAEDREARS